MRWLNLLLVPIYVLLVVPVSGAAVSKKATVLIQELKPQELADILSYPGRVHSRLNAVSSSEIEGQVMRIERSIGSSVKKGDIILTLQNTDPDYNYAPIQIRSLSNGYLTTLDVALMSKVDKGQRLFTITDSKDILVQVEIPERDLNSLHQGMKGDFKPDPMKAATVPVIIEGLSPVVDLKSGTATAEMRPIKNMSLLRQGQLGQVEMKSNKHRAFLVPENAILYRDDKSFIRVFADGKIEKKVVVLGRRMGDSFEVRSGLRAGEKVVTRTSRFVADGEEVEIQPTGSDSK
jgi:multidrug efflux pump subunit AcrA (membrane-fusion protein)